MCRKAFYPGILIVIVLALSSLLFLTGPRSGVKAQTTAKCCGLNPPTAPRELDFPYYSLRDGFTSTLNLVSDSPKPLDFILALHSLAGETLLSSSMTIQPSAKLPVDLAGLITSLGADPAGPYAEGSISIYYTGTIMPLVGQVTMANPSSHLSQEAEMVENDPGRSDIPAVLNGIWWGLSGGRDARIMVANMSGNLVTADVLLDFGGQSHQSSPLVFNPNETKVVSIAQLLGDLKSSPSQAPEGGITIIQRGPKPSLIAQGRVTDPVTGFSTTLEFPDPARQPASALHAVGLPIGTPPAGSPYAGAGSFTPHIIARNLLDKPQTMTVTVEYPKGATWNSTNGPGGPSDPMVRYAGPLQKGLKDPNEALNHPPNPDPATLAGQFALPPVAVGANDTVDYSLTAVMNQLPLPIAFCSIRIQYSGAPGSMIAQAASVDAKQDLVVDARTMNEGDGWAGSGANPWHLDADTQSILFLTDESDQAGRIGFSITVGGVHYYLTSLKLSPHETRAIDIRQLRDAQVADFKKNLIAAGVADGSVNWIRIDKVPVTGRIVVISRRGGVTSSYDYCVCSCPDSFDGYVDVLPGSVAMVPQGTASLSAYAEYFNCNTNSTYTRQVYSDWYSNNTSAATVDHYGNVTGVRGGQATITATFSAWNYDEFTCDASLYTGSGGASVTVVGISSGGCSGSDITGTTQSAVTGQKIELCGNYSLPPGVTVRNQSWSVGGTIVGSYNPSNSSTTVRDATLNQQSTTFYWGYPGSSLNVQFTLNLSDGNSPSPSATFNVTGPTGGTLPTTTYNQVTIANLSSCTGYPAGPYLLYGNATGGTPCLVQGTPGISFNTPSGWSNASGGSFLLVQLINTDSLSGSYTYSFSAGLDKGGYPYATPPSEDGPSVNLESSWTTETRSFNATMFLMWKSNTTGSIPVPLGYQTWAFGGTANCSSNCGSASNWSATTNGTPGDVGIFTASSPSQSSVGNNMLKYGFPEWTGETH